MATSNSKPPAGGGSKPVSSRLLNMKFMQKPLTSSIPSSPSKYSSPSSSPANRSFGPSSSQNHNRNRNYSSNNSTPSSSQQQYQYTNGTSRTAAKISRAAIAAARAEEEAKREAAILNTAAGAEERWSFDLPSNAPKRQKGEVVGGVVVIVERDRYLAFGDAGGDVGGSSDEEEEGEEGDYEMEEVSDSEDETMGINGEDDGSRVVLLKGRRYFGSRTAPVVNSKRDSEDDDDDGDDDGSEGDNDSDSSVSEGERTRRKEAKAAKKMEKKYHAADKALQKLTQIGGRAAIQTGGDMKCYSCGKPGHKSMDCPNKKRTFGAGGRGGGSGRGGRGGKNEPPLKRRKH